jgi:hypothetical protein
VVKTIGQFFGLTVRFRSFGGNITAFHVFAAAGNPKTAALPGGAGSAQHALRAGYSAQIDHAAR